MSHWNYRLVKRLNGSYAIHEVYYDDCGYPDGMTMNPVCLSRFLDEDEDVESLKKDLIEEFEMMMHGVEKRDIFIEPEKWGENENT